MRVGRAAKDAQMIQTWGLASDCLQGRNACARAAWGPVEDMDCAAHGELPVSNCKLCMREHAQGPLGQGAPGALNQSILELAVGSRKLHAQTEGGHQLMELVVVEDRVIVQSNPVERKTI
jgi:hypothetical protein